jgi:ligand-binding sensor domain-containing protein
VQLSVSWAGAARPARLVLKFAQAGVLLLGIPLSALEPTHSITQYSHTAWMRQDSRLPGSVFALAQTTDGRLWVGTEFGLLWFDSVRFHSAGTLPGERPASEYVNVLRADTDGGLWIGTRAGLSRRQRGQVQFYETGKVSGAPGVTSILVDRAGAVWVGTAGYRSGGLCRVDSNVLRCYNQNDSSAVSGVLSMLEDRAGNVWVGGKGLCQWKAGVCVNQLSAPVGTISSIAEDPHGEIWAVTTAEGGLKHLHGRKLVPYPFPGSSRRMQPGVLLSDRDGGLWIGTYGQGLFHLHAGRVDQFTRADGLTSDSVYDLFEDREGNVWAATEGGLDRFRDTPVITLSQREGLSQNSVCSVFPTSDGSVWLGTGAGLNRVRDGKITIYTKSDGLPSNSIATIFAEQAGRLWVHAIDGLAYSENGRFRVLNHPLARNIRLINAAAEDRDGSVWFSAGRGLIRVRDKQVVEVVPWSQFDNQEASALEPDLSNGGLWLGFAQGGIAHYNPGLPARWYTIADGLAHGAVKDLHLGKDGTLWIAAEGGVSRLKNGRVATLTTANGLPCEPIHAMVEDDNGALWLNTACGLVHIPAAELSRWSQKPQGRVSVHVYDSSDGMRTRPISVGYFRRAAKSKDGRLWFTVLDGVAVIDPARLSENRLPPPIEIEQVTAGHKAYPIHAGLELPALTKDLQIDYTAFSFATPEKVRFRYKLEHFDRDWVDAGRRRQAVYTNLPPGRFLFRVTASNHDGVWSETGAVLDFSILPAYYQSNWFRLLCVAALLLLLWSLHRLRLRRVAAQMNIRFEERLAERTRIAREMHDTLLQNMSGFSLQIEGLSKVVTEPVRDRLRDLRKQADECMREAREFVWDLRAPALEEKDLFTALREAV